MCETKNGEKNVPRETFLAPSPFLLAQIVLYLKGTRKSRAAWYGKTQRRALRVFFVRSPYKKEEMPWEK